MINLNKHLDMLGMRVEDRVTGFRGVITSMSFDLYGCIQAIVNPGVDKDGKPGESCWFDVIRLQAVENEPVMVRPEFDWTPQAVSAGRKGPADKPRSMKV